MILKFTLFFYPPESKLFLCQNQQVPVNKGEGN